MATDNIIIICVFCYVLLCYVLLCYAMCINYSLFYDYCNWDDDDCIMIVIIVILSGDKDDDINMIDNM